MKIHTAALLALSLPLATGLAAPAAAQEPTAPDPWDALTRVRSRLAAAGPTTASFEQTYLPVGFAQGETESGRLALALPDCLRWDYDEPYPKSFLVCDDTVYYWNPQDGTGRRQEITSEREPGLDLLLLEVTALKERYRATSEAAGDGLVRVLLEPRVEVFQVRDAVLTLDPAQGRVTALEYTDHEGNRSRFTLSGYAPLTAEDAFTPPADIAWEEPD